MMDLMKSVEFKRKLTAIFCADVEGYSHLMGEDEDSTIQTLTAYRELMSTLIQKNRGRVVDSPGDNLLSEFPSVVDAVRCAVAVQEELKSRNEKLPDNRQMHFRIGINIGDIVEEGERIYGDGVNIAARVESLAKGGSICISGIVYDSVKNKLFLDYESIGEHTVKNIKEPIRVYRIQIGSGASKPVVKGKKVLPEKWYWVVLAALFIVTIGAALIWNLYFRASPIETESPKQSAQLVADKPSIAVLPFENMSKDSEQEYFADGISEDLITDLSKIPDLLVISRLSSFTYKGKSIKVERVAEELGVRYVLEGSVRKFENRIRINAQLIDATNGHHLWADRYDGDMKDIFALQDKITRKIIESLAVKLTKDSQSRLHLKGTNNMEAYEAYMKGSTIVESLRYDPVKFAESVPWFEKAVELDPNYSRAYAALAETYILGSEFGIQDKLGISFRLSHMRGVHYLQMAMKDPTNISYRIAAKVYTDSGQHEKAIDYGMRAITLSPNDYRSNSLMALNLIYAGRPDEAIPFTEKMRRIDPACLW